MSDYFLARNKRKRLNFFLKPLFSQLKKTWLIFVCGNFYSNLLKLRLRLVNKLCS